MRLVVTSDLHYGITDYATIQALVAEINSIEPDFVVSAGDHIGSGANSYDLCMGLLSKIKCPVGVVIGNHDVWNGLGGLPPYSSKDAWEAILPERTINAGLRWMEDGNYVFKKDGIAVVGSVAWYDYTGSHAVDRYTDEFFWKHKRYHNADAKFINWPWSDIEFAAHRREATKRALENLMNDSEIKQIVVVTHVPVFDCQVHVRPNDDRWNFSNGYFSHLTFGEMLLETCAPKLKLVVSGHTHVYKENYLHSPYGNIGVFVCGSDYRTPEYLVFDLA